MRNLPLNLRKIRHHKLAKIYRLATLLNNICPYPWDLSTATLTKFLVFIFFQHVLVSDLISFLKKMILNSIPHEFQLFQNSVEFSSSFVKVSSFSNFLHHLSAPIDYLRRLRAKTWDPSTLHLDLCLLIQASSTFTFPRYHCEFKISYTNIKFLGRAVVQVLLGNSRSHEFIFY